MLLLFGTAIEYPQPRPRNPCLPRRENCCDDAARCGQQLGACTLGETGWKQTVLVLAFIEYNIKEVPFLEGDDPFGT